MSPTDFLITYLAVGSAFAMRAYFRNRRLASLHLAGLVAAELILWLPLSVFRLGKGLLPSSRDARSTVDDRPERDFSDAVDSVVFSVADGPLRRSLSDALERYAALHLAVSAVPTRIDGEFELFSISGHLNGRSGTQCLARRNSARLRLHKRRTVEVIRDLVVAPDRSARTCTEMSERLREFFFEFGDGDSVSTLAFRPEPHVAKLESVVSASALTR